MLVELTFPVLESVSTHSSFVRDKRHSKEIKRISKIKRTVNFGSYGIQT